MERFYLLPRNEHGNRESCHILVFKTKNFKILFSWYTKMVVVVRGKRTIFSSAELVLSAELNIAMDIHHTPSSQLVS